METHYVTNTSQLDTLLSKIKEESRIGKFFYIGFDMEYVSYSEKHTWVKKSHHTGCLMQIFSGKTVLVINLRKIILNGVLPSRLIDILVTTSWIKVGVGINSDVKILYDNFGIICNSAIDIGIIAGLSQIKNPNLGNLYKILFGVEEKNSKGMYDWTTEHIPTKKLEYAAKDAVMSRLVFLELLEPSIRKLNTKCKKDSIKLEWIGTLELNEQKKESPIYVNTEPVSLMTIWCQRNKHNPPKISFKCNKIGFKCIAIYKDIVYKSGYFSNKREAKKQSFLLICKDVGLL